MTAPILPFDAEHAAQAADLIAQGGLVVFPTETVYGLGADARDDAALARLYAAKGRPRRNPLIVHVADLAGAERLAVVDENARALAAAFWPGPLSLVLPKRQDAALSALATAGGDTVALRAPQDPLLREMIAAAGGAVAAPSANPSGRLSPTDAAAAAEGIGAAVDLILDGGPCAVGIESSIVACLGAPRLLREGAVPHEALEEVLGQPLGAPAEALETGPMPAPGMLGSHYAPRARLRLDAEAPAPGEAYLGFGPEPALPAETPRRNLSRDGDLAEAARRLFADLRALDAALQGRGVIAVAPVPEIGLGRAINDRLRRAAAPREAAP